MLLLLVLGKISVQLLRKTIFSYSTVWEGLHEDVLGMYGSETTAVVNPLGGHLKCISLNDPFKPLSCEPASYLSLIIYLLSPKKCKKK